MGFLEELSHGWRAPKVTKATTRSKTVGDHLREIEASLKAKIEADQNLSREIQPTEQKPSEIPKGSAIRGFWEWMGK